MPEPLRRRVRAAVLREASRCAGGALDPLLRGALATAVIALRGTRWARAVRDNLDAALGDELSERERSEIARGVGDHTARLVREWLWMARAAQSERMRKRIETWIDANVEFDASLELLLSRARAGRGVLVATAHLGNWELLAASLRRRALDGAVIGLRKRNDSSADFIAGMRAALGVRSIAQDAPPREALRVLRTGGVLGVVCDLHARRLDNVEIPFFGRPAPTMTAPAALARASGLPLTLARCVRIGERYRVLVGPELELDATLERRAAARDLLARMNAHFECWIREHPSQWAWYHARWPSAANVRAPNEAPPLNRREGDS